MIRLLSLFLLIPTLLFAGQGMGPGPGMPASAGAPSYDLIQEEFEGTGTPAGWDAADTPDFDYATSPAPLTGSESLYLDTGKSTEKNFASQTHVYGHIQINNSGAANTFLINLKQSGSTAMYIDMVDATGGNVYLHLVHGTTTVDTGNFANGTLYVWYEYDNTGLGSVWVSTTTTKPGSPSATTAVGTNTYSPTSLKLYTSTNATIFDRAYVSTTSIGSL